MGESGLPKSMTSPAVQIQAVTPTVFQPKQVGMQSQEWELRITRKWQLSSWPFRRSTMCMFDERSRVFCSATECGGNTDSLAARNVAFCCADCADSRAFLT